MDDLGVRKFPVRIELRAADTYLQFTIVDVEFVKDPQVGDLLSFHYAGWRTHEVGQVQRAYHACGDDTGVLIHCTISCSDHDAVIGVFDKFKDSRKISDLQSDADKPPPYYVVYRVISKLWGKRTFDHNADLPASLGGLVRAAMVAANISDYRPVERFHQLLIDQKRVDCNEPSDLIVLFKRWDDGLGIAQLMVNVIEADVITAARAHFSSIKSVPLDKLPACLRP